MGKADKNKPIKVKAHKKGDNSKYGYKNHEGGNRNQKVGDAKPAPDVTDEQLEQATKFYEAKIAKEKAKKDESFAKQFEDMGLSGKHADKVKSNKDSNRHIPSI